MEIIKRLSDAELNEMTRFDLADRARLVARTAKDHINRYPDNAQAWEKFWQAFNEIERAARRLELMLDDVSPI